MYYYIVPSISISGLDGIPTAGQNYTLTCNTSINNAKFDTYCWIKDNVTLNTTASNSSILRFSPLLLSDGGHYYCGININVEYFSVEHQLKIKSRLQVRIIYQNYYQIVLMQFLLQPQYLLLVAREIPSDAMLL